MRVAMVCPYSLTAHGGVQDQVLALSRAMSKLGVDVRILAPCDGPPPVTGVTALGSSLPTAANGSVAPIAPDIPAQLRLIKAYIHERFDLIHLHEPLAPGVGITTVLTRPAPILATFHAAGRSSSYKYFNPAVRFLRNRIDLACTVSQDAEDLAKKYLGGTYERVFNAVDVERYTPVVDNNYGGHKPVFDVEGELAKPISAAAQTERGSAGYNLLFLGRHEERKGLAVLLEAFGYLNEQVRAKVTLWVAGTGQETKALKSRYSGNKNIEWLGSISEEEKVLRLQQASALVAPSLRGESFGLVLLEAMAAQTPVIASNIDGYREVAQNGRCAKLCSAGSAPALAKAIMDILTHQDETVELVKAGNQRVKDFSIQALARKYLDYYTKLL